MYHHENMADLRSENTDHESLAGVRLLVLNLPEDEGEGLGFRLTRTLWDPYPWVHDVVPESRADVAGLKTGDCLLQADGKDLLGMPIGQVAGLIRGDGAGHGVSLLAWNCGVDPSDDPELLWSCGGGSRGERSRRALSGVVRALSCCVCSSTATKALNCARSHLYCEGCWARLQRCALCREPLPPKDSPYARNLVAEQVFEAIAKEYEIKTNRKPTQSTSAYNSPNRSPTISPATTRRGQYQLSMMNKNRRAFLNDKFASDPNINQCKNESLPSNSTKINPHTGNTDGCRCQKRTNMCENSQSVTDRQNESHSAREYNNEKFASDPNINESKNEIKIKHSNSANLNENFTHGNTECQCQSDSQQGNAREFNNNSCPYNCERLIQHKLVARLRQACSLADLQNISIQTCVMSRSLNNVSLNDNCHGNTDHRNSTDNVRSPNDARCSSISDQPVFIVSPPPIYVLTCEHSK